MRKEIKVLYSDSTNMINMSKERFINLFLINIIINNKKIALVFDTGASITAISESVSDSIGAVPLNDPVTVGGNTGRTELVYKSIIPDFKIENNTIKNLNVIVVPDKKLDFGYDEEGNSLRVNGFLGWDVIKKFKWIIDTQSRTYTIEKPEITENKKLLYWDNMPIINVQYKNNNMYFGFDSGNTESMFSKEFIPFLKTKQQKIDKIAGAGGVMEEDVFLVNSINLKISNKNIELKNISVLKRDAFPTTDFKVMGLLAADIMKKHKCIIDFINHDFQLI